MACGATARRQRLKHSRCSATLRSMSPWSERGSPACRRHCICAKKGPLALPSSKRRTSGLAPPAATAGGGLGAAGRNVGLVNAGAWLPPDELPRRLGQTYGRRLLQTLGAGPDLVFDIIGRPRIDCAAVRHWDLHPPLCAPT